MPLIPSRSALWTLALLFASGPLSAQESGPGPAPTFDVRALPTLGSPVEDRLRVEQLLGWQPTSGYLLRSASTLLADVRRTHQPGPEIVLIAPELRTTWNSALPSFGNDGALWAGRGLNLQATAGLHARYGPVSLLVAPEFVYQENADFQTIAYSARFEPRRSIFASPFHLPPSSLDLPSRFGEQSLSRVYPGQSSLALTLGPLAAGVATENLWWGPGIRNALVMSSNAAGVPHAFLRTARALPTPLGDVEARWIAGRLRESEFFDTIPDNDYRSLSALAVTLRPSVEPNLTLGIARAVYGQLDSGRVPPGSAFDVFRNVGRPNAPEPEEVEEVEDSTTVQRDQVFSLFGRWVFPESGFESYFEWARFEQPASVRDLLAAPQRSQGYTLGLQWANPLADSAAFRLQAELTNLEPSSPADADFATSTYASRAVQHGFTQRGQVIGASIGPGSSSQWLAGDYLAPAWQAGAFGGRVRWETAAFYREFSPLRFLRHDVSFFGGVRGGYRFRGLEAFAEATLGTRFNYLFQNESTHFDDIVAVDIRNYSLRLELRTTRGLR